LALRSSSESSAKAASDFWLSSAKAASDCWLSAAKWHYLSTTAVSRLVELTTKVLEHERVCRDCSTLTSTSVFRVPAAARSSLQGDQWAPWLAIVDYKITRIITVFIRTFQPGDLLDWVGH